MSIGHMGEFWERLHALVDNGDLPTPSGEWLQLLLDLNEYTGEEANLIAYWPELSTNADQTS